MKQTKTTKEYALEFRRICDKIEAEPLSGAAKVHRFLRGLKPSLLAVCSVDPSNHNQIWKGEDFDRMVQFVLTMEQSHVSISKQVVDEPSKVYSIFEGGDAKKRKTSYAEAAISASKIAQLSNAGAQPKATLSSIWPADVDLPTAQETSK